MAYHSLGLRNAMADNHRVAYLAALHALALKLFYSRRAYWPASCLQIEAQDTLVPAFDGLGDFKAAKNIEARHQAFEGALPQEPTDLWDYLLSLDDDTAQKLFAHCAGLSINAIHEPFVRGPGKREHALRLATELRLDMSEQGFVTGVPNFFGRITKATILASVTEAKGEETANLLADMKKKDMAVEATALSRTFAGFRSRCARRRRSKRRPRNSCLTSWRRPSSSAAPQAGRASPKFVSDPSGRAFRPPLTHVLHLETPLWLSH